MLLTWVEAVFAVLALRHGLLYPNLNFENAIKETGLVPQTKFEDSLNIKHVLSNSFGFGGNNSSIILSAILLLVTIIEFISFASFIS